MDQVYDAVNKLIEEGKFSVGDDQFVNIPEVLVDGKPATLDTRFIFNQPDPPTREVIQRECIYMTERGARKGASSKYECGVCSQEARDKCSGCRSEYYCSVECQTKDWISHRAGCIVSKSRRLNQCCRVKCSKSLKKLQFGVPCDNCPAVLYCSPKCRQKDKKCHEKSGFCDLAKRQHEDPNTGEVVEQMTGMSLGQLSQNPQALRKALRKLFNPNDFVMFNEIV